MQPDFAKSGIALFALRNPKYRAHLRASLPFWLNEVFEHYGEVVAFRDSLLHSGASPALVLEYDQCCDELEAELRLMMCKRALDAGAPTPQERGS
jgi:hypothetical protein